MATTTKRHMPRDVAQRIMDRCERNETIVVVPQQGKPSRVFGLEKYLKMRDLPLKVRPWTYRKASVTPVEPLGAVDGRVVAPLTRKNIYP